MKFRDWFVFVTLACLLFIGNFYAANWEGTRARELVIELSVESKMTMDILRQQQKLLKDVEVFAHEQAVINSSYRTKLDEALGSLNTLTDRSEAFLDSLKLSTRTDAQSQPDDLIKRVGKR